MSKHNSNINLQKTLDYIMSLLTTFFNFIEEKTMTTTSSKLQIKKISISDTISSINSEEKNNYTEISDSDIFISKK